MIAMLLFRARWALLGALAVGAWIDRAKREIGAAGGRVYSEAFGRDADGRAAFMLEFGFKEERYRVVWPVLSSRAGAEKAARIQAATMLYHDVKARCVSAKVLGTRAAFFSFLMLPDGRTAAQLSAPELTDRWPRLLTASKEDNQ